jgi:hypothetical protein
MAQVYVVAKSDNGHVAPLTAYLKEEDADAHVDEANCSFRNAKGVAYEVYVLPLIEGGDND